MVCFSFIFNPVDPNCWHKDEINISVDHLDAGFFEGRTLGLLLLTLNRTVLVDVETVGGWRGRLLVGVLPRLGNDLCPKVQCLVGVWSGPASSSQPSVTSNEELEWIRACFRVTATKDHLLSRNGKAEQVESVHGSLETLIMQEWVEGTCGLASYASNLFFCLERKKILSKKTMSDLQSLVVELRNRQRHFGGCREISNNEEQ